MAKKYFLIIDTETTQDNLVADFGAVVCDKAGNVVASCAILIKDIFDRPDDHPLFYTKDADPLWGQKTLPARYKKYQEMIVNGSRMVASVPAINRWLSKVNAKYRPVLTAYNLAFDLNKLTNTGIDHTIFERKFCLWYAAAQKWGHSRAYRQMVLETVAFNRPTDKGNMSYQTKAEIMARFVLNAPDLPDEPHTAYEDALEYELPILVALVKNTPPKEYMNANPYIWKDYQVKDHFKPA